MQMKLIEPKKGSNDTFKTEFKISQKEWCSCLWLRGWLSLAGADLSKPAKQNNRFIYFVVEGDYLNGPKNPRVGGDSNASKNKEEIQ